MSTSASWVRLQHTRIERLILFRDLTLFPDAPGQHNLIIVGERITDPTDPDGERPHGQNPKVSIYVGPARPETRQPTLEAIRAGRNAPVAALLRTFDSRRDPAALGKKSWAEVVMTREELRRRDAVRRSARKAQFVMSEGVIAAPQAFRAAHAKQEPRRTAQPGDQPVPARRTGQHRRRPPPLRRPAPPHRPHPCRRVITAGISAGQAKH
jgi:hypothetical protein